MLAGFGSWLFAAYYCDLPDQISTLKISMGYPAVALGSGAFLQATLGATCLRTGAAMVRCLTYLGKISYGLYVYNWIAISIAMLLLFRGVLAPAGYEQWTVWAYLCTVLLLRPKRSDGSDFVPIAGSTVFAAEGALHAGAVARRVRHGRKRRGSSNNQGG